MKKIYSIIFILCISYFKISSQEENIKNLPAQTNKSSSKESSRWTFSPTISPYIPIINRLSDIDDDKISINNDDGFIYGLKFEKYFPNSKKGFGFEINYLNREIIVTDANRYYFSENAISLTPFYSLKSGGIEQINHTSFEFGLKNQFTFYNSAYRSDGSNSFDDYNVAMLRRFRLYGYLGVGIKKDEFNKESHRIGVSTLNIGIFFPIFNQANLTKNNNFIYPPGFEIFRKSRYSNFYAVLNYFQNIDMKKSTDGSIYQIPEAFTYPKNNFKPKKLFPPLIHWTNPITSGFGNFYLHSVFQPQVDSVELSSRIYSDTSLTIKSSLSWKAGYTYHFAGNYSNFIESGKDRGWRYNLFLGAGVLNKIYNLKGTQEARINSLSIELNAGGRLGYYPPGLFVLIGCTYQIDLNQKLLVNLDETEDFDLANLKYFRLFAGLSIKNAINIRVIATPSLNNYKKNETLMDKLSFSIGFGL
ncbi:MAG: hypothetical protein AAFZ15_29475 [Bacteroidota bacterium]